MMTPSGLDASTSEWERLSSWLPSRLDALGVEDDDLIPRSWWYRKRITTATDSCITTSELQQLLQLVVLTIGGLT
jgi:hypothetical protein